jgi:hypothetical protein
MISGERSIKKKIAETSNLKMISGERSIEKKIAQTSNLKMISGERSKKEILKKHYLCAEMQKQGGTHAGASRGAVIVGRKGAL